MLFLAAPVLGGRVLGITVVVAGVEPSNLLSVTPLERRGTVLIIPASAQRITGSVGMVFANRLRVPDRISVPAIHNVGTTTARELGYPLPVSLVSLQELMNVPLILIVNRRLVAGYLSMGMQIIPIL